MPIFLGTNVGGSPTGLETKALTTHAVIVGMTGSGKTGLVLSTAEELIRNNIPVIILDIKGDMCNLFLQKDPNSLLQMKPRILTPGSNHGESINITSGLSNPDRVSESVTAILDLIRVNSDPITSKQHAFISAILKDRQAKRQSCRLLDLVIAIQEPPFTQVGVMELEEVISKGQRKLLASKLNNVLVADSFEHWRNGIALDVGALIQSNTPAVPVIVYSVAHLANDDERTFAVSLLLDELVRFMKRSPGADDLKVAFILDECYGLMPPVGGGQTKNALITLLKQGRAFGLGLILATQNPMDLDYKGMANCGTWIMGRLQTANDRKRLIDGVCSSVPGLQKTVLEEKIGALNPRQFLLARGGRLIPFYSKDVNCTLKGPMDPSEISGLVPKPTAQIISFKNKVLSLFSGKLW